MQSCRSGDDDKNGDDLREDHPKRSVRANRSYLREFDSAYAVAGIVGEASSYIILNLFSGLPKEQIRRNSRAQESHNGKNISWT
jgi:hypothetical protein